MESASLCLAMAVLLGLLHLGAAVQHTVGGSAGWKLNVNYTLWASSQNFQPGDTLFFNYSAPRHNVAEMNSQAAYDNCTPSNPKAIHLDLNGTVVSLSAAGLRWFVCLVSDHCQQGMKVIIRVGATRAGAPAPGPSRPQTGSATPISRQGTAAALVALATAVLFA